MSNEVTTDLLDDIFASVDAREADPDIGANSCDDESDSDLDVPKALPPSPVQKVQPALDPRMSHGLAARQRAPLTPRAANPSNVQAVTGRGGRMVYQVSKPAGGGDTLYYMVQWRKPQQKKHKTWDGDAFLRIEGPKVTMLSEEGKIMGTANIVGGLPGPGTELRISGMDCEVDRKVDYEEFRRATSCLNDPSAALASPAPTPASLGYRPKFKTPLVVSRSSAVTPLVRMNSALARPASPVTPVAGPSSTPFKAIPSSSFYGAPKPSKKIVIGDKNSKEREAWGGALHNPNAEGSLVMQRPPESEAKRRKTTIVDVVVDPSISSKLRDHQREGVDFMYRCVMGMTGTTGQGCILADEMGLGKTLQTIALIHMLCTQSPFQNESSVISRAIVVCPVTLVKNWRDEFKKWAPRGFGVAAIEDANDTKLAAFTHHRGLNVLIIGYERLRTVIKKLASCQPPIGLVVCDEGHRLKSKDNKTTKMFDVLNTKRRIILTGTPVQNDLGEYWAMANFACPGIFGAYSAFAKQYEKPILKARSTTATGTDTEKGRVCSEELRELSLEFVLRRTAEVLNDYLPPKNEYVVFVAPSKLQLDVFGQLLGGGNAVSRIKNMAPTQCLATIDLLRKVANSPILLRKKDEDSYTGIDESFSNLSGALSLVGRDSSKIDTSMSGKLLALQRILESVSHARDEKIVVVSNWTSTLDLIQDLCIAKRYEFLRLDGSTAQKKRQELVNQFNRGPRMDSMVFLLSAKAGGVGLNLIGASRLVLFDSDWNPSTDLQAMARIHRDGQKKQVFIYRLLTANTIDEKIYQRQLTKTGLSEQMMAQGGGKGKETKDSFSFEELRDIFTINVKTDGCGTHDLLGCECGGFPVPENKAGAVDDEISDSDDPDREIGFVSASQYNPEPTAKERRQTERAQQAKLASLKEWSHVDACNAASIENLHDNLLYNLVRDDYKKFGKPKTSKPATKKRKSDVFGDSDPDVAVVPDSADESGYDSDTGPSRRRKRAAPSPTLDSGDKKHDLRDLAESKQAGRILYVFEKLSKSRL